MLANSLVNMREIEYLQTKVYPTLHAALVQLIDHVVKTEEVRKHQERLKKIKIFDKIEQKKVEKERLKKELGSAYGSSSEGSIEYEEMGMNQSQLRNEDILTPIQQDLLLPPSGSIDDLTSQELKKEINISLRQIQEDQEEEEIGDKHELENLKQQLRQKREEMEFNPLIYLAQLLRTAAANK